MAAIFPKAQVDQVYLAGKESYDGWIAAMRRVRDEMDVASIPAAVALMARLAHERLDQIKAEQAAAEAPAEA